MEADGAHVQKKFLKFTPGAGAAIKIHEIITSMWLAIINSLCLQYLIYLVKLLISLPLHISE